MRGGAYDSRAAFSTLFGLALRPSCVAAEADIETSPSMNPTSQDMNSQHKNEWTPLSQKMGLSTAQMEGVKR